MSKELEFKLDPNNARLHSNQNRKVIHDSVKNNGAGRSIVVDNDDTIIAGEGVYVEAKKLGKPMIVVETDGDALVVVKRIDLNYDDKKRKKLAIADNLAGDLSEFNYEKFQDEYFEELDFTEIGLGVIDTNYTPVVNPSTKKHDVTEQSIQKKRQEMNNAFSNATEKREEGLVGVLCPECYHEFSIKKNG